jgi:hypothetical protein
MGALSLVALLLATATACAGAQDPTTAGSPEPSLTSTAPVPPDDAASASIDAAKQRAADEHARDVAAAKYESEPAGPDEGVFDSAEAPFSTIDFRATSHWGGRVEGKAYVVYAGEDGQHPSMGEVIVDPYSTTSNHWAFHRLNGVGALTIVDESGGLVVLRDAKGAAHLFDVSSDSFQD